MNRNALTWLVAMLALAFSGTFVACDTDDDENGTGGTIGTGGAGGEGGSPGTGGTGGVGGTGGLGTGGTGGEGTGGTGGGGEVTVETTLSGENETPPVTTDATGTATATLTGSTLVVEGSFSGLGSDFTVAHVHTAPPGEPGDILFPLDVTLDEGSTTAGTFTGTHELDATSLEDFMNGLLYVNVHSVDNPEGELRGQLVP